MNPKVVVVGFFRFPPDKMPEILPQLEELLKATRMHDGCIAYDAAEDPFDRGVIRFSEVWPDHESLDRHLKAPHILPWREAVRRGGLIERHFIAYDISGSRGI